MRIGKQELYRAFEVNDALVQERKKDDNTYQADALEDLDVDVEELAEFAAEYAIPRVVEAEKDPAAALTLTFSMGAVTALRAKKLVSGS